MKSLPEIKALNAGTPPEHPVRRCAVSPLYARDEENPTAVIIHSAQNRCTKFIDLASEFKREYFHKVCKQYDVDIDLLYTRQGEVDGDKLDRVVESYWGHYPQPTPQDTPGYHEA